MKCQIENIKDTIAKDYGFSNWNQFFEFFITTKPGREVIQNGLRKVLWKVLLLSKDSKSYPDCFVKNDELKEIDVKAKQRCFNLCNEFQEPWISGQKIHGCRVFP